MERTNNNRLSMRRIIVVNSKGGCGKTTIATNLASLYAQNGFRTALYDYDPQGSSTAWLQARPAELPEIYGVAAFQRAGAGLTRSWQMRVPPETERLIIDTPAGLDKPQLLEQLRGAHMILVPVTPSAIDTRAAVYFIRELVMANKTANARIGVIANRIKDKTLGAQLLADFLAQLELPVLTYLRDSQTYVLAAERGLGAHELDPARSRFERPRWQQVLEWLETPTNLQPRPITQALHA